MYTQTDYPAHIYDPLRREIATRYIRHELRKLFSDLKDENAWQTIDADVAKWYQDDLLLMPVRDFWNGLHGISMGFRLKNIVSWLTSANIRWEEREVPVDELWFGSIIGHMELIGYPPSAKEARTWFYDLDRADVLEQARAEEAERSNYTMPRNDFPIFAIRKEGKLRVTDGNRRLLRAILHEQKTIKAYVGEPIAEPVIFEDWVPTQIFIDLVSFYRYSLSLGRNMLNPVADIIAERLRDSSAGRFEFAERSISKTNEADMKLLEAVRGRLKKDGIIL